MKAKLVNEALEDILKGPDSADVEKARFPNFLNRCLTIVVLPDPEGAEKIIALPFSMTQEILVILVFISSSISRGTLFRSNLV